MIRDLARAWFFVGMASGFVGAGCADSGAGPSGPVCDGGKCDAAGLEALPAPAWVACWVEVAPAGGSTLLCELKRDAVWAPTLATVQVRGADHAQFGWASLEAGVPATIGDTAAAAWPLEVLVDVDPNFSAILPSGAFPTALQGTLSIASASGATPTAPAVLMAPFGLWPIELATTDGVAIFNADATVVSLGGWTAHEGEPTFNLDWGVGVNAAKAHRYYLPIPASGGWTGALQVVTSEGLDTGAKPASFTGPGRWVATADGLRPATEADLALFETPADPTDPPDPNDPIVPIVDPTDPTDPIEPACADADYLTWIADYGAAVTAAGNWLDGDETAALDAKVAAKPCTPASGAAFGAWNAFFVERLGVFLPAASSTLDQDERTILERLVAVAPATTDDGAYVAWHGVWAGLYEGMMPSDSSTIDSDEGAVLDLVARVRPDADGDGAFEVWHGHFAGWIARCLPSPSSSLDDTERANLAFITAARPDAASALAYVGWLSTYRTYFERALPSPSSTLDNDERANLDFLATVRPAAVGDAAWNAWFEVFTARLGQFGSTVDSDEQSILATLAAVKPCGDATSAATFASATGDAAALALADPAKCD